MHVVLLNKNLEMKGVEKLHNLFSTIETAAVEGDGRREVDGSRSKTGDFSLVFFLYFLHFFSIF